MNLTIFGIELATARAFLEITRSAGFPDRNVAFVTTYLDRGKPAFKKTAPELAWNSFAWLASEPDHIVVFREGAVHKSRAPFGTRLASGSRRRRMLCEPRRSPISAPSPQTTTPYASASRTGH